MIRPMMGDLIESDAGPVLVNARIVNGDDSVRKYDWFEVTHVCAPVIRNIKTFEYLSVSRGSVAVTMDQSNFSVKCNMVAGIYLL